MIDIPALKGQRTRRTPRRACSWGDARRVASRRGAALSINTRTRLKFASLKASIAKQLWKKYEWGQGRQTRSPPTETWALRCLSVRKFDCPPLFSPDRCGDPATALGSIARVFCIILRGANFGDRNWYRCSGRPAAGHR